MKAIFQTKWRGKKTINQDGIIVVEKTLLKKKLLGITLFRRERNIVPEENTNTSTTAGFKR